MCSEINKRDDDEIPNFTGGRALFFRGQLLLYRPSEGKNEITSADAEDYYFFIRRCFCNVVAPRRRESVCVCYSSSIEGCVCSVTQNYNRKVIFRNYGFSDEFSRRRVACVMTNPHAHAAPCRLCLRSLYDDKRGQVKGEFGSSQRKFTNSALKSATRFLLCNDGYGKPRVRVRHIYILPTTSGE